MYRNKQDATGFQSILYSIGLKPLQGWDFSVKNGHIKRVMDDDIKSSVIEIIGANVNHSYLYSPADPSQTLGIHMPSIVLLIKNVK
jgi:hypothetical protein